MKRRKTKGEREAEKYWEGRERPGFIEFELCLLRQRFGEPKHPNDHKVICFSSARFTDHAIEIPGNTMPATWLWPYKWEDLNIMREGYMERHCDYHRGVREYVPNLKSLNGFIRAFDFPKGSTMWMHIWYERLKLAKIDPIMLPPGMNLDVLADYQINLQQEQWKPLPEPERSIFVNV